MKWEKPPRKSAYCIAFIKILLCNLVSNVVIFINRKNTVFWASSSLKKVGRPGLQEPLLPPAPTAPMFNQPCNDGNNVNPNLLQLYQNGKFTDVAFKCRVSTYMNSPPLSLYGRHTQNASFIAD